MLTQEKLKELFDYQDGQLIWKVPGRGHSVGGIAGSKQFDIGGYARMNIDRQSYATHRIIFLWHYGFLPNTLDHINGKRTDNRIENLRPATHQENLRNMRSRGGSSNYKGVHWLKQNQKWRASFTINYKTIHLGLFNCEDDAAMAYNEAALQHFGIFARFNESSLNLEAA